MCDWKEHKYVYGACFNWKCCILGWDADLNFQILEFGKEAGINLSLWQYPVWRKSLMLSARDCHSKHTHTHTHTHTDGEREREDGRPSLKQKKTSGMLSGKFGQSRSINATSDQRTWSLFSELLCKWFQTRRIQRRVGWLLIRQSLCPLCLASKYHVWDYTYEWELKVPKFQATPRGITHGRRASRLGQGRGPSNGPIFPTSRAKLARLTPHPARHLRGSTANFSGPGVSLYLLHEDKGHP